MEIYNESKMKTPNKKVSKLKATFEEIMKKFTPKIKQELKIQVKPKKNLIKDEQPQKPKRTKMNIIDMPLRKISEDTNNNIKRKSLNVSPRINCLKKIFENVDETPVKPDPLRKRRSIVVPDLITIFSPLHYQCAPKKTKKISKRIYPLILLDESIDTDVLFEELYQTQCEDVDDAFEKLCSSIDMKNVDREFDEIWKSYESKP